MKKVYLDPRMPRIFNALKGSRKNASAQKYLQEAYEQSLVPQKQNPIGTPDAYPFIFGESGYIAKTLGKGTSSKEYQLYRDKILSNLNGLAQTITELTVGLKVRADKTPDLKNKSTLSAFQHPSLKGMSPSDKESANRSVEIDQYIRYTIQALINASLYPVFETSKNDVFNIIKAQRINQQSAAELKNPEQRRAYQKDIANFVIAFIKKAGLNFRKE